MINYPYPTLFLTEGTQKDYLITDGTVTVSGTTYTVSNETVLIDNSILDLEAFELYQSLNSEMQIQFGSCETASIRFTIHKNDNSNITGTVLTVYLIPNHDASKMLQIGVFKVVEDVRSQDHQQHTITAYDAMYDILNKDVSTWYNAVFPYDYTTVTLLQLRISFLTYCNITAEATSLANDDKPVRKTLNIVKDDGSLDFVSGADIIRSICQINGVFGVITNEGNFRFVSLVDPISSSADTTDIPVSYCLEVTDNEEFNPFRGVEVKSKHATAVEQWGPMPGGRNLYSVANNILINDYNQTELGDLVHDLFGVVDGHKYTPFTLTAIGNPLHEVGDPIKVYKPDGTFFYSYIFERRMSGIQALRDTYTANGSPVWDKELNSISSRVQAADSSSSGGGGGGGGAVSTEFTELIRNIGFRLLDEPTSTSAIYDDVNNQVELKWTDPADIPTSEPVSATWAGTVVVRKEDSAPLNRWDGVEIGDSTTRDEYSTTALVDNTTIENKHYYYGIFPYDSRGWYRYTKICEVYSSDIPIPTIVSVEATRTTIHVVYIIPINDWDSVKLVYKKNSEPQSAADGVAIDITGSSETIIGLDAVTLYYLKIYAVDHATGRQVESVAQSATTEQYPSITLTGYLSTHDFS